MAINAIISYDDSLSDHDALMFGHVLSEIGARLTLAYVRHTTRDRPDHERLDAGAADALLARGAAWLQDASAESRVVLSGSTAEGLAWLAANEPADVVVFGSEYRTPHGHVSTCRSAQRLLERSPAAVAIAPAGYRVSPREIATVGVLPGTADEAAIETAFSIAARLEASVVDRAHNVDLLIVGSRRDAAEGVVSISASAQNAIEDATCPVLVVARGVALHFDTLVTA
ncbi:MAG TPA: universal stress protein [Solirubrobacteraceae bacterium]|nr:universal stress protein [Solirubrobacteraceae bacterium]